LSKIILASKTETYKIPTAMKKTLLLLSLIGGLASASAATYNISNQDNNLFLGFYAADEVAPKSVLINLGTSADVSRGFTLDLSSASSALSTTYGTNWFNNSQVYWGLIGYDGELYQNGSFYVARPTSQPLLKNANDSTTLNEDNYFTLSDQVGTLITAHTAGAAEYSTVLGSAGNTHQISSVDNINLTTFAVVANNSYNTFTSTVYDQVGSGLSIQQFTYDGAGSYPTTFEGTFGGVSQLNGVITVVPEPSTYALLGLGSLLLIMAYRRRA
jgi:hypothetical protein